MPDPIQISSQSTYQDFKEYLKKFWKMPFPGEGDTDNLPANQGLAKVADAADKSKLPSDYAKIGAFLVNKSNVIKALKPLDDAIKSRLELTKEANAEEFGKLAEPLQKNMTALKQNMLNAQSSDPTTRNSAFNSRGNKPFKTFKLLSGLLDEAEAAAHFNGAQSTLAKLHSSSLTTGDQSTAIAFQSKQPQTGWKPIPGASPQNLPQIDLPKGAPTLTGILTTSFNPVLLRNGFHWKDPGADAEVHGEYTHRLQWYAILHAENLGLVNTPVQIFKSMGYLAAGAKNGSASNKDITAYIWELLFDNFAEDQAEGAPGKPFTTDRNCFTCPNYLNEYLSKSRTPSPALDSAAVKLPWLNVLMNARQRKRAYEKVHEQDKTYTKIHSGEKPVSFGVSTQTELGQPMGGAIWWPKH